MRRHTAAAVAMVISLGTASLAGESWFYDFEGPFIPGAWTGGSIKSAPVGDRHYLESLDSKTETYSAMDFVSGSSVTDQRVNVACDLFLYGLSGAPFRLTVTAAGGLFDPPPANPVAFDSTFSLDVTGAATQYYPDAFGGAHHPPFTGATEIDSLGLAGQNAVYHLSFQADVPVGHAMDQPHDLTVRFNGDGPNLVFWGLDNVAVSWQNVPEPSTPVLAALGGLALLVWRWRLGV